MTWPLLRAHHVGEAASGSAALDALQDYVPDLVVLDLTMRDMDGAVDLPRSGVSGFDVPVVLASGYVDQELERRLESSALTLRCLFVLGRSPIR